MTTQVLNASVIDTQGSPTLKLLRETFKTPFIEMIRNEVSLLKFFPSVRGVGLHPMWKVQYGSNTSAGPYAEEDTIGDGVPQSVTDASVNWALNRVIVRVTGLAQAATRGAGAFYEALAFEMKWALPNLRDQINSQLLSQIRVNAQSGSGVGIDSLGHILITSAYNSGKFQDGTTSIASTYAGISRSLEYWKPHLDHNNNTPRPLTVQLMQGITAYMEEPNTIGPANIDTILTSRSLFNSYGNLMQDQRQYVNTMELDGGFTQLPFEGRKITVIPGLATGDVYFLQKNTWEYQNLLDFQTEEKATDNDSQKFVIKTYSQLVCKAPARNARLMDVV